MENPCHPQKLSRLTKVDSVKQRWDYYIQINKE